MNLKANKNIFQIPQAEKYLQVLLPRLEEKRFHSFTTIIFSLFTFSFFGIFAIAPTLSTITDLKKQISDSEFVNQQLQQKIANLTQLQVQYKNLQPDLPIVYGAIPQDPQVTQLVGELQSVAKNTNVTLTNIQTLPVDISAKSSASYNSFTFTIDVAGTYSQVQAFLQLLTNFNRIVTIDALALTKPLSQSDGYSLSVRGKVYFVGN